MKSSFYKADNISIFLDMKLADMISIAESAFACGVASGVYGKKTESGTCTPNPVYAYIGRRIAGEHCYEMDKTVAEIAGGYRQPFPRREISWILTPACLLIQDKILGLPHSHLGF